MSGKYLRTQHCIVSLYRSLALLAVGMKSHGRPYVSSSEKTPSGTSEGFISAMLCAMRVHERLSLCRERGVVGQRHW